MAGLRNIIQNCSYPLTGKRYYRSLGIGITLILVSTFSILLYLRFRLNNIENTGPMYSKLSEYQIYTGYSSNLNPTAAYQLYELSTPLFTDYAEKQRLIKLPAGTALISKGDGLPQFPDGTILVKTFYYFNDKRDLTKGKRLIETRILIKKNSKWIIGTYVWNREQTEAFLSLKESNTDVFWISNEGENLKINYHIPGHAECTTCHETSGEITPIGPKLRNLNRTIQRGNKDMNQLDYLGNAGILKHSYRSIGQLPGWQNKKWSDSQRARAYLDVNCAHCHNAEGYAARTGLFLNYEATVDLSGITKNRVRIVSKMAAHKMPQLGTTVIDQQGLKLIRTFVNRLKSGDNE